MTRPRNQSSRRHPIQREQSEEIGHCCDSVNVLQRRVSADQQADRRLEVIDGRVMMAHSSRPAAIRFGSDRNREQRTSLNCVGVHGMACLVSSRSLALQVGASTETTEEVRSPHIV